MQRRRVLGAMADLLGEKGWRGVTVVGLANRAEVSPATIRDLFGGLEGCLLVLLERVMVRSSELITEAFERQASWQGGVLAGLEALLVFLESEPALARVCVVEALAGPPEVLRLRARSFASLTPLLDRAREQLAPDQQPSALTATATIEAVAGMLHRQYVEQREPVLAGLLGDLAGLVVSQYLGQSAASEQIELGNARAGELTRQAGTRRSSRPVPIPKEIRHASAARVRSCLLFIAENPGASNQAVAKGIGMSHLGQISMVLSRLHGLGMLDKRVGGAGRPNAWRLTPRGEDVVRGLDHS
jgi:AcrR family transcriptional regulator